MIYYLNLVKLTKMIFLFLRDVTIYHHKLNLHYIEKKLIDNHTDANKGRMKGYFYLEVFFGFVKVLER